ncbi:MAG TPA: hypothetical protein VEL03_01895 [Streptosporangiaceae bacterium]|nr:hypothetical protein [Streptosporangiaceae bacterium]
MTSGRVENFLPSTGGFQFENSFPAGNAYPAIALPVIGTAVSQDVTRGLCGGFTFAARDLFDSAPRLRPPDERAAPADGSVLFDYLVARFLASLGSQTGWANTLKIITWTQVPDLNADVPVPVPGLAWRMVEMEWPDIKADIDAGHPSPLFLVLGPQGTVRDVPVIAEALRKCHQVLAYGYDLDRAGNLTLWVYDPNDPGNDSSTVTLNISSPDDAITISAPDIEKRLGNVAPLRGVFRGDYAWSSPVSLGTARYPLAIAATEREPIGASLGFSVICKVAL